MVEYLCRRKKSVTTLHSNDAHNLGSSIININIFSTLSNSAASKHLFQLSATTVKLPIVQTHFDN